MGFKQNFGALCYKLGTTLLKLYALVSSTACEMIKWYDTTHGYTRCLWAKQWCPLFAADSMLQFSFCQCLAGIKDAICMSVHACMPLG